MLTADTVIRLKVLDGTWETCGVDRFPNVVPESLDYKKNSAGADTCSFVLRRNVADIHPDLSSFTPCEIEIGGQTVWGGYVWETPSKGGADAQISVSGRGWQYALDDDVSELGYVHTNLADWKDTRSIPGSDLTIHRPSPVVRTDDDGSLTLGWPKGVDYATGNRVAVTLDLGPNVKFNRFAIEYDTVGAVSTVQLDSIFHSVPYYGPIIQGITGDFVGAPSFVLSTSPSGFYGVTASSGATWRYITLFLIINSGSGTMAADVLLRLKRITAFCESLQGYDETYGGTILTSSKVVYDAVKKSAPLLTPPTFTTPRYKDIVLAEKPLHYWPLEDGPGATFGVDLGASPFAGPSAVAVPQAGATLGTGVGPLPKEPAKCATIVATTAAANGFIQVAHQKGQQGGGINTVTPAGLAVEGWFKFPSLLANSNSHNLVTKCNFTGSKRSWTLVLTKDSGGVTTLSFEVFQGVSGVGTWRIVTTAALGAQYQINQWVYVNGSWDTIINSLSVCYYVPALNQLTTASASAGATAGVFPVETPDIYIGNCPGDTSTTPANTLAAHVAVYDRPITGGAVVPIVGLASSIEQRVEALRVPRVGSSTASTYTLPSYMPGEYKTTREHTDAANAIHDWSLLVSDAAEVQFNPRSSVPDLVVGSQPGSSFDDISNNSGEDMFNRAVLEASSPDGSPLRVERWADGDKTLSGVAQIANPSGTVNTAGWTVLTVGAITRDTSTFVRAPASLNLSLAVTGTGGPAFSAPSVGTKALAKGQRYRLSGWLRGSPSATFGHLARVVLVDSVGNALQVLYGATASFSARFNNYAPDPRYPLLDMGTWTYMSVDFVPSIDYDSYQVYASSGRSDGGSTTSGVVWFNFADIRVERMVPTLLDRRGRVKTKILPISSKINEVVGGRILDLFLASHRNAPFKGTLTVTGNEAVRKWSTGEPVALHLLPNYAGKLVHFADRIDPFTGALGRDGRMADGEYDTSSDVATLSIDNTRADFEAFLARLALITG